MRCREVKESLPTKPAFRPSPRDHLDFDAHHLTCPGPHLGGGGGAHSEKTSLLPKATATSRQNLICERTLCFSHRKSRPVAGSQNTSLDSFFEPYVSEAQTSLCEVKIAFWWRKVLMITLLPASPWRQAPHSPPPSCFIRPFFLSGK